MSEPLQTETYFVRITKPIEIGSDEDGWMWMIVEGELSDGTIVRETVTQGRDGKTFHSTVRL